MHEPAAGYAGRLLASAAAIGVALIGMAWAYGQGQEAARSRRIWETSPARLRLPDGTWVDAENLADAGQIMKAFRELNDLPQLSERARRGRRSHPGD